MCRNLGLQSSNFSSFVFRAVIQCSADDIEFRMLIMVHASTL